MNNCNFVFV